MEFEDRYGESENIMSISASHHFIYISENIPTKDTEEHFNEIFTGGCECVGSCVESKCACLRNQVANYVADKSSAPVLNPQRGSHGFYECNDNCKCFPRKCGNRVAQFGPRPNLQVIECSSGKGQGLITTRNIAEREFICEYAGEVLSQTEARNRFQCNEANNFMNYVICVREYFGLGDKLETYIDPFYFGNIGRFLNHSCAPNCILLPIRVNHSVPKLGIFAKCVIEQNCELTFDYSGEEVTTSTNAGVVMRSQLRRCLCGENNCRKWLPYDENIAS